MMTLHHNEIPNYLETVNSNLLLLTRRYCSKGVKFTTNQKY